MSLWVDGNDSNMELDSIMVPGTGEKRNLWKHSVVCGPWRKLIERKQKWVCTFGKAYLKYEIGLARAFKKDREICFLFSSVSKNEVFTKCISFCNHSFDRRDSPEAGHTQFTRPIRL